MSYDSNSRDLATLERSYSRIDTSILSPLEAKFLRPIVRRVPSCIHPAHLVLLSFFWSLCNIAFGFMAAKNRQWLWAVSVIIILQTISDYLDGSVAMLRHTGLVLWGYYMDHFLDYIFLVSIIIVYYLASGDDLKSQLFILFAVLTSFMIHTFLVFSVT